MQYPAKLLFQYRRKHGRRISKRCLCEERIVTFKSPHPEAALATAKRLGRDSEHDYAAADGGHIYFEFLGIIDLIDVSIGSDEGEVWFEFYERLTPRKRLSKLIPKESELTALREGAKPVRFRLQ